MLHFPQNHFATENWSCPNMTALNWSVDLDSIPTINEYKGVL